MNDVPGHRLFERPIHIAESHPRVSDNGSYVNLAAAGPMPGSEGQDATDNEGDSDRYGNATCHFRTGP
jgi:hypothetical protein